MLRRLAIPFMFFLASAAVAAPLPGRSKASPLIADIQVSGAEVSVTGFTPSRPVAVVAAWRIRSYDTFRVEHGWRDGTTDRNGALRVTFDEAIPPGALLLAIDVATGHVETLDYQRQRFGRIELPAKRFKRDGAGDVEEMSFPHDSAAIVLVREAVGVWIQIGGDGGNADHDSKPDGFLRTHPSMMIPIAGSPAAPAKIEKRDVVLLLDAMAGLFGSTEVRE